VKPDLQAVVERLASVYAPPAPPSDPFRHILWDNIGYLIDDRRRRRLFDAFAEAVGLDPLRIAQADEADLMAIAQQGGMRPEERVQRWRTIASLIAERPPEHTHADLDAVLRALPLARARTLLKRFPTIADPAADKILLFAGIAPLPALESNGVRVLARLGLFREDRTYAASYRAAITVLAADGQPGCAWLAQAFLVLREHGKTLCKRGEPHCGPCLLSDTCPRVRVQAL
jgi:endonuclease III